MPRNTLKNVENQKKVLAAQLQELVSESENLVKKASEEASEFINENKALSDKIKKMKGKKENIKNQTKETPTQGKIDIAKKDIEELKRYLAETVELVKEISNSATINNPITPNPAASNSEFKKELEQLEIAINNGEKHINKVQEDINKFKAGSGNTEERRSKIQELLKKITGLFEIPNNIKSFQKKYSKDLADARKFENILSSKAEEVEKDILTELVNILKLKTQIVKSVLPKQTELAENALSDSTANSKALKGRYRIIVKKLKIAKAIVVEFQGIIEKTKNMNSLPVEDDINNLIKDMSKGITNLEKQKEALGTAINNRGPSIRIISKYGIPDPDPNPSSNPNSNSNSNLNPPATSTIKVASKPILNAFNRRLEKIAGKNNKKNKKDYTVESFNTLVIEKIRSSLSSIQEENYVKEEQYYDAKDSDENKHINPTNKNSAQKRKNDKDQKALFLGYAINENGNFFKNDTEEELLTIENELVKNSTSKSKPIKETVFKVMTKISTTDAPEAGTDEAAVRAVIADAVSKTVRNFTDTEVIIGDCNIEVALTLFKDLQKSGVKNLKIADNIIDKAKNDNNPSLQKYYKFKNEEIPTAPKPVLRPGGPGGKGA